MQYTGTNGTDTQTDTAWRHTEVGATGMHSETETGQADSEAGAKRTVLKQAPIGQAPKRTHLTDRHWNAHQVDRYQNGHETDAHRNSHQIDRRRSAHQTDRENPTSSPSQGRLNLSRSAGASRVLAQTPPHVALQQALRRTIYIRPVEGSACGVNSFPTDPWAQKIAPISNSNYFSLIFLA